LACSPVVRLSAAALSELPQCPRIVDGWMPKQAAFSFLGIFSAKHIIFVLFSIDMSFDFMSPAVEQFAPKNRTTLHEGCFNTADDNQLIAFLAKLEQRGYSKPSTEL
jgi:hypothetical protein